MNEYERKAKLAAQARARRKRNPDTHRKAGKRWRTSNPTAVNAINKRYSDNHKSEIAEQRKARRAANPMQTRIYSNAASLFRNRRKKEATPPWVSRKDFTPFMIEREWLSRVTGISHHVDHMIPLLHEQVCGLNVPDNLIVVPHYVNESKGNRFFEELAWVSKSEYFQIIGADGET